MYEVIKGLIEKEALRQSENVELIASENFVSPMVLEAMGSCLTNKYAEGYPAERSSGNKGRYYGGCEVVNEIEEYCCNLWRKVFNTDYHVNVQPHSGSQANACAYAAVLRPGDTILAMNLNNGGHLTHGSSVNFSGKLYDVKFYDVDENGFIDYEDLENKIRYYRPKLVLAGASAYSRIIDFERMANIAHSVGAYLMVDMAHIAGLIAAGLHPSPVPYADVVTSTTHKTLRGPRGGIILCKDEEFGMKFNKAIFPGTQGGPLMHIIAGKAVCFGEALSDDFKEYQKNVVANAAALAKGLTRRGIDLVSGGTDNHLMLVDLRSVGITGKELEHRLDEVYITANKNAIPNDPEKPFVTSGVRLGTPAVTTRGLDTADMDKIAEFIYLAATDFENKADYIRQGVEAICKAHPLYE